MKIREVSIAGYRSLRAIRFPVGQLTVFVGANGVGKTNLYRALQLLQAAAAGTLARELASEGGMDSAVWAGKRKVNKPVRIKLYVGLGADTDKAGQSSFDYDDRSRRRVFLRHRGRRLPMPAAAALGLEPQVKEETLIYHRRRAAADASSNARVGVRPLIDDEGRKHALGADLLATETALGALRDPGRFGDIDLVRRTLLDWRFYHDFRSDKDSPLRQPCLAVTTPTLASDGCGPRRRVRDADCTSGKTRASSMRPSTTPFRARGSSFRRRSRTAVIRPHPGGISSEARVRGERAVRRHAALSGACRRLARLSPARLHRAERA